MKTRLPALLLAGLLAGSLSAQTLIYVDQNAPASGANNGASWVNAYHELRDALNDPKINSATSDAPVTIVLARGVYKPTAGTDRTASFLLKSHLRILGGFAAGDNPNNPPRLADISILSGDIGMPQKSPVTVANFAAPPAPGVIAIQPVADDFVCAFRAQPAQTYIIEESASPAGPWTVVGPAIANSNGAYTFRDTDVSPTQRFFRIVTQ